MHDEQLYIRSLPISNSLCIEVIRPWRQCLSHKGGGNPIALHILPRSLKGVPWVSNRAVLFELQFALV